MSSTERITLSTYIASLFEIKLKTALRLLLKEARAVF